MDDAPGPRPTLRRLAGVYDADGTIVGELSYVLRVATGGAHCSLCDVTHGRVRERADWRACRDSLGVPFETYHRNDQPAWVAEASSGTLPIVVAEDDAGTVRIVATPADLDRCAGSPERLVELVRTATAAAGIDWPSAPAP